MVTKSSTMKIRSAICRFCAHCEAAEYCDDPDNRVELAEMLSKPSMLVCR